MAQDRLGQASVQVGCQPSARHGSGRLVGESLYLHVCARHAAQL